MRPNRTSRRALGSAVILAVGLAGACGAYTAGSFRGPRGPFPGSQLTVGCLDVAVASLADASASGPVAEINFGNRCDTRVSVDLGAIAATGRSLDGREIALAVYDPLGEIRPGMLDANMAGREVLEFSAPGGGGEAFAQLCLDLSRLDPAASAPTPIVACVAVTRPDLP